MVVARLIASDVAARGLTPGSPLAPEQEMARDFGVGRPSVREALRLLEAQGLVTIRPGQGGGPVVGSPSGVELGETMSLYFQIGRLSYREVMQTSITIQGQLARRAAEQVAAGHDERLAELMAASRGQARLELSDQAYLVAGVTFHQVVAEVAASPVLQLISEGLDHIYARVAQESHEGHWEQRDRTASAKAHIAVAEAIAKGAADRAARLQEQHLQVEIDFVQQSRPGLLDQLVEWR